MKPLNNLVLVKVFSQQRESHGLIINQALPYQTATVVRLPISKEPLDIMIGDNVIFQNGIGLTVGEYTLVNMKDILAVVEGENG